jgi:DNA-binding transcriptional MocR family regulator
MSHHPRPWHRASVFGDGYRVPLDRERRAVWKARVEIHRRAGRLTDGGSYVALALLKRLGSDGRCDPSQQTLADDSGESIDTVQRALKALYAIGMVTWLRRLIREGNQVKQTSNSYLLTVGQTPDHCESDSARETRKARINKGLPKDPTDRVVFDVPTEDRLAALAALADVAQRRSRALWQ